MFEHFLVAKEVSADPRLEYWVIVYSFLPNLRELSSAIVTQSDVPCSLLHYGAAG